MEMAHDGDAVHEAISEVLAAPPEEVMNTEVDILDVIEPTRQQKFEVRILAGSGTKWPRVLLCMGFPFCT